MKTEVKPVAENEVELAVEVARDDVEAKIERTITRLARETTIPGFRKGKVPRQIVLSRLGEDYVLSETLNEFLPEWYESAVDEAELDPVSTPEIDFGDFTGKEPFAFTAKVQVRPEPVLGQYTGLEVEKDTAEVTDAQVDAQLAMLQERFASLKPVEGRAAAKGDFAQIDFAGTLDDAPLEGAQRRRLHARDRPGQPHPGLRGASRRPGGRRHDDLRPRVPRRLPGRRPAGQDRHLHGDHEGDQREGRAAARRRVRPQASEFDTLAALRDDMRTRLQAAREEMVEREYRNRVIESGRRQRHREGAAGHDRPAGARALPRARSRPSANAVSRWRSTSRRSARPRPRPRPTCVRGPRPRSPAASCSRPSATPKRSKSPTTSCGRA